MSQRPSRSLLIASIVVALGALLVLNAFMQRLDPKYQEQRAQEEAQRRMQEQQKQQQGQGASSPSSANAGKLVELGDETILGKKDGKPEVVIGFAWTPEVQADPSKVYGVVDMITKGAPNARIRVVNADARPGTPLGVSVQGRVILPAGADGGIPIDQRAGQAILHDGVRWPARYDAAAQRPPGPAAKPQ